MLTLALMVGLVGIFGGWPSLLAVSLSVVTLGVLHAYGVAMTAHQQATQHVNRASGKRLSRETPSGAEEQPQQPESSEPVTVIIPLYNEERFLGDCLDSLLAQSWPDWTAIVVDDASTDDGPKLAAEYAGKDPRIQLSRHLVNSGLSAARNTGLRLSQTKLITFLDSDDMLTPDSLAGRIAALERWLDNPEVAGVYSGIVSVPEDADITFQPGRRTAWDEFQDLITAGADCPFNAHAPLLKTDLLRKLGGFDESMRHGGEDWDLWQRLMRHGYYFRSARLIGGLYRRKRNSMVRSLSTEHLEVATGLYSQAQRPLDIIHVDPEVAVLDQPLQAYVEAVPLSTRVIGFAAMSYVEHGKAGLERHLAYLPEAAGPYLLRHLNLDSIIEQGVMRGLAITEPVPGDRATELTRMTSAITQAVRQALTAQKSQPATPARRYEAIYLAGDAFEAGHVLAHVREAGLRESDVAVLDPAAVNGAQGAEEALAGCGVRRFSVNELVFHQPQAARIVCLKRHGFGVDLLKTYAEQTGAAFQVLEVPIDIVPDAAALPPELSARDERPWDELSTDRAFGGTILMKEELFSRKPDVEKIQEFRNIHAGDRCVIVGNGPSLNEMDLSRLSGEHTIAVNGIFYKTEETGFRPRYYVVEDSSVMRENIDAIRKYDVPFKFFPTHYQSLHPAHSNVAFFRMNRGFYEQSSPNYCVPRFSTDFSRRAFCGQSVTYINLQLAFFMGFSEVYLIGMDFSYHIPDSAIRDGDLITSTEDDPNHFNGAYFGAGKTWKDPKLDRVLQNYKNAKRMYEADGRRILNATVGGSLELFDRVDFRKTFGG